MTDRAVFTPSRSGNKAVLTWLICAVALATVAAAGLALDWLLGSGFGAPPPPRNPFGIGIREGGGSASGVVGWILAVQSDFYRSLTSGLKAMKADGSAFWVLTGVSFAYGVFHAAGPGHGKAVISAYIIANEAALKRGLVMAGAAALLQAIVAITLVTALAILLGATAMTIRSITDWVEIASFAAVALLGAVLLWRKASALATIVTGAGSRTECDPDCGHVHLPGPAQALSMQGRERAAAILAAGIRPCSGAIIVLVFALSQGLYPAGIAAVLAMALGTAVTTGALAALSVFAKGAALQLASGRGEAGLIAIRALEVVAAALVSIFGVALLAGLWTSGTGG